MTDHIAVLEEIRERGQFPHWLDLVDVANAIDAAIALMRGQSWQDIATAPKDGRRILACSAGGSFSGRWSDRLGWVDENDLMRNPTHWQPLPAPPAAKQERDDA